MNIDIICPLYNTEQILKEQNAIYKVIEPQEFSHSLTREKEAFESDADILVFITQDIIIKDEMWLYHLVKDIENEKCDAAYSRQLCDNNSIEKYTRELNYPKESYTIKYCADSKVIHSHEFTFKQQYDRYYITGKFFKQNDYLNEYKVNDSGFSMAKYILKRAIQEKNLNAIIRFLPNMSARLIGMKVGKITYK